MLVLLAFAGSASIGVKGADAQLLAFAVKIYLPFVIEAMLLLVTLQGALFYFGLSIVG